MARAEADGEIHDPLRHFAIDLAIFDSRITIDSVTCIPLVSLPPATNHHPGRPACQRVSRNPLQRDPVVRSADRPRSARAARIEPGKQTIALDFNAQDAPVLVATPAQDHYAPQLFGAHVERRSDGSIAFTEQDPRITWELDYAEAYWITHSIAGELMVNLEKLQHPTLSDDEARVRMLDALAAQISDAVRPETRRDGGGRRDGPDAGPIGGRPGIARRHDGESA